MRTAHAIVLACLFAWLSVYFAPYSSADEHDGPQILRIGVESSFFKDVPKELIATGRQVFASLMKEQTGLINELKPPMTASEMARELAAGRLDLGLFQGVEFARASREHAELRPLVVLMNQHLYRQAHLMVRQDSPAAGWADLRDKLVAVPAGSREHCWFFLAGNCKRCGLSGKEHFAHVAKSPTVEGALDDLVDGLVSAAVVDGVGLEAFQRRKPGRFARIKELQKSELFPDSVVAYRLKSLSDSTLRRCRDGLLNADKSVQARFLMMLWRVTAFAPVPPGFDDKLTEIGKAYDPSEWVSGLGSR